MKKLKALGKAQPLSWDGKKKCSSKQRGGVGHESLHQRFPGTAVWHQRGHLAIPGDNFGCHNSGAGVSVVATGV